MLTLLGTIFGLIGSLLPEILSFFKQKEDHQHEVEMAKIKMQIIELEGRLKLDEINAQADIEEAKAIYQAAEPVVTGVKFIDGLVSLYQSSVRPTLTYAFMAFYGYIKISAIYGLKAAGWTWWQIGQSNVWGSDDFAIFSTIIAFWFGGRFMKYALNRVNGNGGVMKYTLKRKKENEDKGNSTNSN